MTVMTLPDAQQLLAMPDSGYMNSVQRAFFRQLLQDERQKLLLHNDELKKAIDSGEATGDEAACCRKSMRRWRGCRTANTATAGKPANP